MPDTIIEKRDRIIEEMSLFDDSYERFAYVIEKGKKAEGLPEEYKTEAFRIEGCMSNLYLVPEFKDGLCYYRSDSDSPITQGVANLLCELYSGHTPDEVLSVDPVFLSEVGITQHLSSNRRNGLSNVTAKILGYAELQKAKAG
ncbi:MAG: SufE family protein [Verrucomicrobiae bacterium]|nr:SufE family protein [Verrucomicrobiae bacterium]